MVIASLPIKQPKPPNEVLPVAPVSPDTRDMAQTASLKNQFLIAMPSLRDPNFNHTVTYICEHSDQGAMGIVVNRPSGLQLIDILNHMNISDNTASHAAQTIYIGGPVEAERGFVLHSQQKQMQQWDSTMPVTDEISVTTSRDILESMARDEGPAEALVALGYAGWSAGQLEAEIQQNTWLSGPSSQDILFKMPAGERWAAAARLLGVDMNLLTTEAGHA